MQPHTVLLHRRVCEPYLNIYIHTVTVHTAVMNEYKVQKIRWRYRTTM